MINAEQSIHVHGLMHSPEEWSIACTAEAGDHLHGEVNAKECYNNAWNLVTRPSADLKYVVGMASSVILIDHAWVFDGAIHYDPTWARHTNHGDYPERIYHPIAILSVWDLCDVMMANDYYPPSAWDMITRHLDYCLPAVQEAFRELVQEDAA